MIDIVEWLRGTGPGERHAYVRLEEAASEIERLRAALREFSSVMDILSMRVGMTVGDIAELLNPVGNQARAALEDRT